MRSDMKKVIIERPRVGGYKRPNRKKINHRIDLDDYGYFDDGYPRRLSAKRDAVPGRYGDGEKSLNDLLGPIRRFLQKSVGRPWNEVWSEICENNKDYMGEHLKEHVLGYVTVDVFKDEDGTLLVGRNGYPLDLYSRNNYYVDPDTGKLALLSSNRNKYKYQPPQVQIFEMEDQEYYKYDGIWYRVKTEPIEWEKYRQRNVFGKYVSWGDRERPLNLHKDVFFKDLYMSWDYYVCLNKVRKAYGKDVVCIHKEQANSKECKRLNKMVQEREAA